MKSRKPRPRFTDTRDRLERAAIRLFVQKGVTETSVRDIANAVDITEGALYRHFPSKDELVWRVFEHHYVAFAHRLHALAEEATSAHDKLRQMIRGFCEAHDEDPVLFRFLLFVQHGQLPKLAPGTLTPVDVMRGMLEAAIAAREIPEQHPGLATALIFGVVLEPAQFAAYGQIPFNMGAMCDRLISAAWAAVTTI
jgi:AcrR family transcriptional regulator